MATKRYPAKKHQTHHPAKKSSPHHAGTPPSSDRVPTGIPGLDHLISGGLEKNSTTVVKGGAGSGKTILSLQFIHNGCTKYNESGAFISFSEPKSSVFATARQFGWELEQLEKSGSFQFIQYAPHEIERIVKESGGSLRDTIESIGAKRVVIDSLTAYMLVFKNDYELCEGVLDFMNFLKSCNCTTVVTEERDVTPHSSEIGRLSFLSDAMVNLYHLRKESGKYRAMEVIKMRHTDHSDRMHLFNITGSGIVVASQAGVFEFSSQRNR